MKDINYTIEQVTKRLNIPEYIVNDIIRYYYQTMRSGLQEKKGSYYNFGGFGVIRFHSGMSIRYMNNHNEQILDIDRRLKDPSKNYRPRSIIILKEKRENNIRDIKRVYELSKDFKAKTGYTKEYAAINKRVDIDIQNILESGSIPEFFPDEFKADYLPKKNM